MSQMRLITPSRYAEGAQKKVMLKVKNPSNKDIHRKACFSKGLILPISLVEAEYAITYDITSTSSNPNYSN